MQATSLQTSQGLKIGDAVLAEGGPPCYDHEPCRIRSIIRRPDGAIRFCVEDDDGVRWHVSRDAILRKQ